MNINTLSYVTHPCYPSTYPSYKPYLYRHTEIPDMYPSVFQSVDPTSKNSYPSHKHKNNDSLNESHSSRYMAHTSSLSLYEFITKHVFNIQLFALI